MLLAEPLWRLLTEYLHKSVREVHPLRISIKSNWVDRNRVLFSLYEIDNISTLISIMKGSASNLTSIK